MILIQMRGGLCNNMFYYALYQSLLCHGKKAHLDQFSYYAEPQLVCRFLYNTWGIKACKPRPVYDALTRSMVRKVGQRLLKPYYEKSYGESKEIFSMDHLRLMGYWQSEKYFSDKTVQEKLRKDFATPAAFRKSEPFVKWHDRIERTNSVSIHIRRGDYLTEENAKIYCGICTDHYYQTAIAYMLEKEPDSTFYIFSDDKEYAAKMADRERFILVEGDTLSDVQELYLMSYCRHHILANSSYSWWGSWLNEQDGAIVLAPERWDNLNNPEDIYREHWIRIPCV